MELQDFAREMCKEAGIIKSVSKALFRKGLKGSRAARIGKRVKNFAARSTVGRRGMVGSGVRGAAKDFATNPVSAVKKSWGQMGRGEKVFNVGFGGLAAHDATGKLEKGETRLGRIGSAVGSTAGYMVTPFKRVGMLGNILAGDIVGGTVGRKAGRAASKITGVGGKSKAKSFEDKFK